MTNTRDTRGTLRVSPPIAPPHGLVRGESDTTTFVGRGDELMQLDALYMMMLGGRRQVVFVQGDIGVGKSSLVDAFVARVAAQHAWPVYVSNTTLSHLTPGGARVLAEDLTALAIERPVLLVLEDLHSAELAVLDLVSRLAHGDDALHLMIVATARPDPSAHALMAHDLVEAGLARRIALSAFGYDDVRMLVGTRAPHRMGEARAIFHLTGGHPAALAEVIDAPHIGSPDALRQLVAHQLARIMPSERRVIFAAAQREDVFSARELADALGANVDDVDLLCDDLAEQGDFLVAGPLAFAADGRVSGSYRFNVPVVRTLLRTPVA